MKQKFKFNTNLIIILLIIAIIGVVGYSINYAFFSPTTLNKYIATNLYKTLANTDFTDDNYIIFGFNPTFQDIKNDVIITMVMLN